MIQKCPFFDNVQAVENVNAGGRVGGQKQLKSGQRSFRTTPYAFVMQTHSFFFSMVIIYRDPC